MTITAVAQFGLTGGNSFVFPGTVHPGDAVLMGVAAPVGTALTWTPPDTGWTSRNAISGAPNLFNILWMWKFSVTAKDIANATLLGASANLGQAFALRSDIGPGAIRSGQTTGSDSGINGNTGGFMAGLITPVPANENMFLTQVLFWKNTSTLTFGNSAWTHVWTPANAGIYGGLADQVGPFPAGTNLTTYSGDTIGMSPQGQWSGQTWQLFDSPAVTVGGITSGGQAGPRA